MLRSCKLSQSITLRRAGISKLTFDVAIISNFNKPNSYVFDNTNKGISAFLRLLKNQNIQLSDTLICMEHTGVYGKLIILALRSLKLRSYYNLHFLLLF